MAPAETESSGIEWNEKKWNETNEAVLGVQARYNSEERQIYNQLL